MNFKVPGKQSLNWSPK